MIYGRISFAVLILFLAMASAEAQNSPNGPPGPEGNPTPPNNGNNGNPVSPLPPAAPAPNATPVSSPPPESPEGRVHSLGQVERPLLLPVINSIANVSGLSSTMVESAQSAATSVDNNLEQRMTQIRRSSIRGSNVSLYEVGKEAITPEPEIDIPRFGFWATGSGLYTRSDGTKTSVGTLTAGFDAFLNRHMVLGVMGVYVYGGSSIPGITGRLLTNAEVGGVYFGAWTGSPGLYVTFSGLVNHSDFTLVNAFSPRLLAETGFGQVGYTTSGDWKFGPVASCQFDTAATNGFAVGGLGIHRNTSNTVQIRLGASVSHDFPVGKRSIGTSAQLMWEHQHFGNGSIDAEIAGIPDTRISTGKGASDLDSVWGSVGIDYKLSDRWALNASYSFDLGNDFNLQKVDFGLSTRF